MAIVENDMYEITESIWGQILQLSVVRQVNGVAADQREAFIVGCAQITGSVQITGAWEVTVFLECSEALACRATAIMFGMEPDDIVPDDLCDAVGELTNMIAGSFKSLLPGSCTLSMPTVKKDLNHADIKGAGEQVASQVAFACEGEPFRVTLLTPDIQFLPSC